MFTKYCPPVVFVTMFALLLIACCGVMDASYHLAMWNEAAIPFPMAAIIRFAAFVVVPLIAMKDIFRRKISGRYLALLSMMAALGIMLRFLTLLMYMGSAEFTVMVISTFICTVAMAALILRFGFSEKVNRYFYKSQSSASY